MSDSERARGYGGYSVLQFSQLHCRAGKFFFDAGAHRFTFADLALVKEDSGIRISSGQGNTYI